MMKLCNIQEQKSGRNAQIDSLRGCMMLMILCFHLLCRYLQLYEKQFPTFLLINRWGVVGYTMFFLISGYFLTGEKKGGLPLFGKRFFKLWPTYVVAITIVFCATRFYTLPDKVISLQDYLCNVFFINGFIYQPYLDGAHWYLTTLIGCILIYSLILLIKKKQLRITGMLIWLIVMTVVYLVQKNVGGLLSIAMNVCGGRYMPMVVMGSAVAYMQDKETRILGAVLAVTCLVSVCVMLQPLFAVVLIADTVAFLLMFYFSFPQFINKIFGWFGEISYSVYLIHSTLGYLLIYHISRAVNGYHISISLCTLFLMIGIGWLLHLLVEKPMNRLTAKFFKKNTTNV